MLIQEQAVEIRVLALQGHSIRQIAKTLGVSRNTVRRYLREPSVPRYSGEPRPTKLDAFDAYLHARVQQAHPLWLAATVLLREIRERGYDGEGFQLRGDASRGRVPGWRTTTAPDARRRSGRAWLWIDGREH